MQHLHIYGDKHMKILTSMLFAFVLVSGSAFAEIDVQGQFPWPDTYNAANESVNCEDRCFFNVSFDDHGQSVHNPANDDVNAEK